MRPVHYLCNKAWTMWSLLHIRTLPQSGLGPRDQLPEASADAMASTTTKPLARLVDDRWRSAAVRPLFAGPLRTMIQWEEWR